MNLRDCGPPPLYLRPAPRAAPQAQTPESIPAPSSPRYSIVRPAHPHTSSYWGARPTTVVIFLAPAHHVVILAQPESP